MSAGAITQLSLRVGTYVLMCIWNKVHGGLLNPVFFLIVMNDKEVACMTCMYVNSMQG
jgi:hypothetical protein